MPGYPALAPKAASVYCIACEVEVDTGTAIQLLHQKPLDTDASGYLMVFFLPAD
jgi:hypothetical protein